ncbi:helix-turn-helix domain-containing protein [Apilactobacillus micheneri]|uniref:helix-turn-helix domain-containing protein n=1 Tax=Apilactobacillus micheneri TaxID=1899430 RepID=UPI00112E99A1|nr:helix-turn-helix transcriptional regulator [Apilactobacillus micheneri]TPR49265.1 helix-turn-helix domain-containing protein [Apilactobacillus micheneri]
MTMDNLSEKAKNKLNEYNGKQYQLEFFHNIFNIMSKNDLSPREFAQKTGLPVSYISTLIYRPYNIPSIDVVMKIANTFNLSVNKIFNYKAYNKNFFFNQLLLPELLKQNIGINELSSRTGITKMLLDDIKNGKIHNVNMINVISIAKALNVDPAKWLLKIGQNRINANRA